MNDKKKFEDIRNDFCHFIESCSKYTFYTRAKDLQHEKIIECQDYIKIIKQYKYEAMSWKEEYMANQLFHMQCIVNAFMSFLLMWVHIKEEKFNDSWISLIDAYEYVAIALKIDNYESIQQFQTHLKAAEKSLFPNWKFYTSSSFTETIGKCSICAQIFTECNHLENEIYMGSLCIRVDRKMIKMDHVSFVENPRDRRCIITTKSDDDKNNIDRFTLKTIGKVTSENIHFQAIAFHKPNLDIF